MLRLLFIDTKSLVRLGRNHLWSFLGALLDFLRCDAHWKSSYQNAYTGIHRPFLKLSILLNCAFPFLEIVCDNDLQRAPCGKDDKPDKVNPHALWHCVY